MVMTNEMAAYLHNVGAGGERLFPLLLVVGGGSVGLVAALDSHLLTAGAIGLRLLVAILVGLRVILVHDAYFGGSTDGFVFLGFFGGRLSNRGVALPGVPHFFGRGFLRGSLLSFFLDSFDGITSCKTHGCLFY